MEWVRKTLIDDIHGKQTDNTQIVTVGKQTEVSNKRLREEEGFSAQAIAENKFKIIYSKKAKMTTAEKEKSIEIDYNEDQQTDDEATLIVNETLKEIQQDQESR